MIPDWIWDLVVEVALPALLVLLWLSAIAGLLMQVLGSF